MRWSRLSFSSLVAIGLALAVALLQSACSRSRRVERVTLGEVELPAFGLVFIAEAEGYFREENVEVIARKYPSGRDALAAMLAGEVDGAVTYGTPLAVRALDSPDLRVLTTLHWSVEDNRVLARRDRGILTPRDLRGRKVGVPRKTSAEFFLDTLLASAGVRPDEITRIDLAPSAAGRALERGEIDAIAIWYPQATDLKLAPEEVIVLRSSAFSEISVLATRATVLERQREAFVRVLRALSRAEQLAQQRPAVALAALERAMDAWPAALLREAWARTNLQLGLTNVLVASIEQQLEWQRPLGGAVPDVRRLLDPTLLREVDRESVTLLEGGE